MDKKLHLKCEVNERLACHFVNTYYGILEINPEA